MSLSKPSVGQKRKRKALSLQDKLSIIEKLEKGASVSSICREYEIAKQTVSDIKKSKNDIRNFVLKFNVEKEKSAAKRMRLPSMATLDDAVYKWFSQLRSCGMAVRGIEIQAAAERLSKQMGLEQFKASSGWLFRFRRRHNISNKKISGEILSADFEAVEPFIKELDDLIKKEGYQLSQIYNFDETGLFWRTLPDNTQASKAEKTTPGRKVSKERVSVLLCANADGTHMLKPAIVGKSKKPRALKNVMDNLPVHYYSSRNAWFTTEITSDWFHKKAVPAIINHQMEILNIPKEKIKALVLLDNAPTHPDVDKLCSRDKKIKCKFLPPNTTSVFQPMDQGVIYTAKRLYRKKFLNEILEVDEPSAAEEDRRGQKTLQNLKAYNIRSMIHNFADAVKEIKPTTLVNSWKKLLKNEEACLEIENCETEDFRETLQRGGEEEVLLEDVETWLEEDEDDPGFHLLTEEEIVGSVTEKEDSSEDEEEDLQEEDNTQATIKVSEVKDHLNFVIEYVEQSKNENVFAYYEHLRHLRQLLTNEINNKQTQQKINTFFKPVNVSSNNLMNNNEPGPSCSRE